MVGWGLRIGYSQGPRCKENGLDVRMFYPLSHCTSLLAIMETTSSGSESH